MLRKNQQRNTKVSDQPSVNENKMQSTTVASSILFWRKWLLAVVIFQAVFGLAMILLQDFLDEYLWNVMLFSSSKLYQTFTPEITHYIHLLYGVMGAVMVGWSVLLFFHVKNSFASGDRQAWLAILLSVVVWYVIDSIFSIAMGFWQNAVLNTGFAILYVIPLAATSKYFKKVDVPYI